MILGTRATISGPTLIVMTAMLLVGIPGAVLAEDATLPSTEPDTQPGDKASPSTGSAKRFQPSLPSMFQPASPSTVQPASPSTVQPTLPATVRPEIVQAVLSNLGSEPKLAKDLAKNELDALQQFYAAEGREALWVSREGMNTKAQALVAEFANAGEHGLRPSDYQVPIDAPASPSPESLAKLELDLSATALTYARHAKGGRTSPDSVGLQLTYTPAILDPLQVLNELSAAADPAAYLRSLHPTHPQYLALREKLKEIRGGANAGAGPKIPEGPVLKKGVSHAHVALLRDRLGVPSPAEGQSGDEAKQFDTGLEEAVKAFQGGNGLPADGVVGAGTRRLLNGRPPGQLTTKILINMERWRWLPDELGGKAGIYVWANLPELRVRAVQGNDVVFSEKAIVGQVSHKTPVFSDAMEWIELHPVWFVPNSIKVNDILPSLKRPTSTVMERYDLKMNCGRHGSNPKTIDWDKVDIRKCAFSQPPGKSSVLGDFKFKFPNKHSVYMHDTHDHSLFKHTERLFSHGCIRVQQPRQLAEILLKHDKGMTAEQIGKILSGPQNLHKEELNQPIPVHVTYFTALFDDQGKFTSLPDYYGHDQRLAAVLSGKSHTLAKADAPDKKVVRKKRAPKEPAGWWGGVFSAN